MFIISITRLGGLDGRTSNTKLYSGYLNGYLLFTTSNSYLPDNIEKYSHIISLNTFKLEL